MNIDHQKTRMLIADSQFLIVEGLKSIFADNDRYSIIGFANTRSELKGKIEELGKGILIVDLAIFDLDGITELENLKQQFPNIQIVILTNSISKTELVELTKSGFKNIIYKTADRDELFSAIEATLKGKKYYSSELLDLMLDLNMDKQTIDESKALTPSEIEIVKMVSQGFTTKEIAFRKNISFHTVNTHRKNIFRKMDVSNVSELIMKAIKLGWIDNIEYYI
jgi:DNA-binding NarL/FixJ family response regulator